MLGGQLGLRSLEDGRARSPEAGRPVSVLLFGRRTWWEPTNFGCKVTSCWVASWGCAVWKTDVRGHLRPGGQPESKCVGRRTWWKPTYFGCKVTCWVASWGCAVWKTDVARSLEAGRPVRVLVFGRRTWWKPTYFGCKVTSCRVAIWGCAGLGRTCSFGRPPGALLDLLGCDATSGLGCLSSSSTLWKQTG